MNHETEFPSKRTIIRNGKKVTVCEKFVAYRVVAEIKKEIEVTAK